MSTCASEFLTACDMDVLQCPKCLQRLEALELDLFEENGETFQRIWWTCRGLRNKTCQFPLWIPRDVFWTKRTEEQMRLGFIPLPNLLLLPEKFQYLYPKYFSTKSSQGLEHSSLEGRDARKLHMVVNALSANVPKSGGARSKRRSSREASIVLSEDTVNESENVEESLCTTVEVNVVDDKSFDVNPCESSTSAVVNDGESASGAETPHPRTAVEILHSAAADNSLEDCLDKSADRVTEGDSAEETPSDDGVDEEDSDEYFESAWDLDEEIEMRGERGRRRKAASGQEAAGERDELQLQEVEEFSRDGATESEVRAEVSSPKRKRNDPAPSPEDLEHLESQQRDYEAALAIAKTTVSDLGYTLRASLAPNFSTVATRREKSVVHRSAADVPSSSVVINSEAADDPLGLLKMIKVEPRDDKDERIPFDLTKGSAAPFRQSMLPSDVINGRDWRRPLKMGKGSNLDGLVSMYNLHYNRDAYLDAMCSELYRQGIMKFEPSIPIKQQRLVRQMLETYTGSPRSLDVEALKRDIHPNTLRLQIAHRLGIRDLNSLKKRRGEAVREENEGRVAGGDATAAVAVGDESAPSPSRPPLRPISCVLVDAGAAVAEQPSTSAPSSTRIPDTSEYARTCARIVGADCATSAHPGESREDQGMGIVTRRERVDAPVEVGRKFVSLGSINVGNRMETAHKGSSADGADDIESAFEEYCDDDAFE